MRFVSENVVIIVGGTTNVILENLPATDFPHCFVQWQVYDDGGNLLTPGVDDPDDDMDFEFQIQTVGSPYWEDVPANSFTWSKQAEIPQTVNWNANTAALRLSLIAGAGLASGWTVRLTLTCNLT